MIFLWFSHLLLTMISSLQRILFLVNQKMMEFLLQVQGPLSCDNPLVFARRLTLFTLILFTKSLTFLHRNVDVTPFSILFLHENPSPRKPLSVRKSSDFGGSLGTIRLYNPSNDTYHLTYSDGHTENPKTAVWLQRAEER